MNTQIGPFWVFGLLSGKQVFPEKIRFYQFWVTLRQNLKKSNNELILRM